MRLDGAGVRRSASPVTDPTDRIRESATPKVTLCVGGPTTTGGRPRSRCAGRTPCCPRTRPSPRPNSEGPARGAGSARPVRDGRAHEREQPYQHRGHRRQQADRCVAEGDVSSDLLEQRRDGDDGRPEVERDRADADDEEQARRPDRRDSHLRNWVGGAGRRSSDFRSWQPGWNGWVSHRVRWPLASIGGPHREFQGHRSPIMLGGWRLLQNPAMVRGDSPGG